jgi:hypothetical protein
MKKIFCAAICTLLSLDLPAQPKGEKTYTQFPLILTIQFHSLALPFQQMKSNFSNAGIGVGTELSYNGKQSFVQQVSALWYRNRTVGNGLFFYTQPVWRPTLHSNLYTEIKGGIGYLIAYRPVESFRQVNGTWESAGHKGKGMLAIPIGISFGYNTQFSQMSLSPFISYQLMIVSGYNKSIPVVPETLIQIGSRFHFSYK